ncbi:hypothetical protein AXG93_1154s2010 [Marchantia polymorpha subsp. ruderalis]|uniref:Uncharacterized protein n=1 Tax=Marchantia polymorpha subsp. ruderalis TaxID=1480154 RepID=A0A176WTA0_MARPO|nr:hypothetical protein AXG93_1154s2010 [Marchantia polymorpha subsp. ruderalis]
MDGKQAVKRRERKVSSSRQRHGKPEPGIAVYVCSNVCTKQLNVMWPMAATGSTVLGSTVRSTIGLESTSGTSGCTDFPVLRRILKLGTEGRTLQMVLDKNEEFWAQFPDDQRNLVAVGTVTGLESHPSQSQTPFIIPPCSAGFTLQSFEAGASQAHWAKMKRTMTASSAIQPHPAVE